VDQDNSVWIRSLCRGFERSSVWSDFLYRVCGSRQRTAWNSFIIAATARLCSPVVIIFNDFLLRESVISSCISVRCLLTSKTGSEGVAHGNLSSFQFGCLQCNKFYDRLFVTRCLLTAELGLNPSWLDVGLVMGRVALEHICRLVCLSFFMFYFYFIFFLFLEIALLIIILSLFQLICPAPYIHDRRGQAAHSSLTSRLSGIEHGSQGFTVGRCKDQSISIFIKSYLTSASSLGFQGRGNGAVPQLTSIIRAAFRTLTEYNDVFTRLQ
jgi:hypothetical protein